MPNLPIPDMLAVARFRKSRRSNSSGSCVEVADNLVDEHGVVLVRDSKNRDGGTLAFTRDQWTTFLSAMTAGQFDL